MAREVKIGLALVLLLVAAFGVLMFKKMQASTRVPTDGDQVAEETTGELPETSTPEPAPPARQHSGDGGFARHEADAERSHTPQAASDPFATDDPLTTRRQSPRAEPKPLPTLEPSANSVSGTASPSRPQPSEVSDPFFHEQPRRSGPDLQARTQPEPRHPSRQEPEFGASGNATADPFADSVERNQSNGSATASATARQHHPPQGSDPFAKEAAAATEQTEPEATTDPFGSEQPSAATMTVAQDRERRETSGEVALSLPEQDSATVTLQAPAFPQPEEQSEPKVEPVKHGPEGRFGEFHPLPVTQTRAGSQTTVHCSNEEPTDDPFGRSESIELQPRQPSMGRPRTPAPVGIEEIEEFPPPARQPQPQFEPPVTTERPRERGQFDFDHAPRQSHPQAEQAHHREEYEVEPNDNFWTISKKRYGTGKYFMALARFNAEVVPDPKHMKPGMKIATPAASVLEARYPDLLPKSELSAAPAHPSPQTPPGFLRGSQGEPLYGIGPEDTLSGIAQKHLGRSSRWIQIYEMNRDRLADPNALTVGTVLRLPADAVHVEVVHRPTGIR